MGSQNQTCLSTMRITLVHFDFNLPVSMQVNVQVTCKYRHVCRSANDLSKDTHNIKGFPFWEALFCVERNQENLKTELLIR